MIVTFLLMTLVGSHTAGRAAETVTPIAPKNLVFAEAGGRVAVEAEHFVAQSKTDKRAFHITSTKHTPKVSPDGDPSHADTAAGGAYVEALPDTRRTHGDKLVKGENFSDDPGAVAVLTYRVHFQTTGRYYVWVRAFSTGTEDNGIHVGLDDTWPESGRRMQWSDGKNSWRWESKQRTADVHTGVPGQIYLDIENAGVHEIQFSMREDGFEFDRWLMTTDKTFKRPVDAGPPSAVHTGTVPDAFPVSKVAEKPEPRKPNVIFILSDDLAQGDLGCYGQKLIKTPRLDAMAKDGMRFTQAYCGTSVCAPSRTSLMIGKHIGHSPIRANREVQPEGQKPLPAGTYTVAKLFKDNGYATACVGKWGMGLFDTTGSPLKVGFDHFFGYNCQRHAHSYFPTYLYRDAQRFELPGNDGKTVGRTYAQNLIADETVAWVTANKDRPFFLFYSMTLPHGRHEIDDQGIYKNETWTEPQKNYAAQVTRLDTDIGRLLDSLKERKLDDNTLVIVAGDNGSSFAPNSEIGRLFDQTMGGQLRGFKRSLFEGGLRQACLARWPGVIPAGMVSNEPWAFWDFMPTCADLLNARLPEKVMTDGVSILPLLKGGATPKRDYFYWELHEAGPSLRAVRFGDWKGVKVGTSGAMQLYDLKSDPAEKTNVAAKHPDLAERAAKLMAEAREDHPDWPLRDRAAPKK